MKNVLRSVILLALFFSSCSKSKIEPPVTPPEPVPTAPVVTQPSMLTDPVNCPPTLYQSNANAFQLSFARMKLIKGMTGQLTNVTPNITANYSMHVYLRGSNGSYYHLPATTIGNIAYNYTLTAAFPQSSISVKRGTGPEEIFESMIVLGAKSSYLSTLPQQINFADYGAAKLKLGF